jgi:hypothetical protein
MQQHALDQLLLQLLMVLLQLHAAHARTCTPAACLQCKQHQKQLLAPLWLLLLPPLTAGLLSCWLPSLLLLLTHLVLGLHSSQKLLLLAVLLS